MLATADVRRDCRKLGLTGVFYVTGNAKIKELSLGIECSIIMPGNVSVSVESLADYRADEVGISILVDVGAGRVKRGREKPGITRVQVNCLRSDGISICVARRTNPVELQIAG